MGRLICRVSEARTVDEDSSRAKHIANIPINYSLCCPCLCNSSIRETIISENK